MTKKEGKRARKRENEGVKKKSQMFTCSLSRTQKIYGRQKIWTSERERQRERAREREKERKIRPQSHGRHPEGPRAITHGRS